MSDLIYPTLDLFLFDLKFSLNDTEADINERKEQFKLKLPPNVQLIEKTNEDDFAYLLKDKYHIFEDNNGKDIPFPLDGYYYPAVLGDSYGLLLDCSVKDKDQSQPADYFGRLKAKIEEKLNHQKCTIGQTWMMSGWLSDSSPKTPEDIAKSCYQALMPEEKWAKNLEGSATFGDISFFELWRLQAKKLDKEPTSIEDVQENQHVIIIIYPNQETFERESSRFYKDWMVLFYYRHKILWAYGQSSWLIVKLKKYFVNMDDKMSLLTKNNSSFLDYRQINDNLEDIKLNLIDYTRKLNYLELQINTIDINLGNYQKRLAKIKEKLKDESIIKVLENFSDYTKNKYLLQIQKDYENLTISLKILDPLINTLRGQIELDKAEKENFFQKAVAIIGVGLGAASAFGFEDKICNYEAIKPLIEKTPLCTVPMVYTLMIGIISSFITWLVIRLWRR